MKTLTTFCFFLLFCFSVSSKIGAQPSKHNIVPAESPLPAVFMLGEYGKEYEEIMPAYETLLEACDGEMELAFNKLMGMVREMEAYASLVGYDLKGVNAWMHFFWRPDGTIEHIGFYLKPNSRNVNTEGLKSFLTSFTKQYKLPLRNGKKFAHYSSFSFPITHLAPSPSSDSERSTARRGN